MLFLPFLLVAPKTLPLAKLFGKPRTVVEQALGTALGPPAASRVGGYPRLWASYDDGGSGASVGVDYVNGRARLFRRAFGATALDWKEALLRSGFPLKGISAFPDSVHPDILRLTGGALADCVATYGPSSIQTKPGPPLLEIAAPYGVAFPASPADRKAALDAFRPVVERAFHGQKTKFVVDSITVVGDWSFVVVEPVSITGGRLDVKDSDFAARATEGMIDRTAFALLRRVPKGWSPVATALFPTDVAWEPWSDTYKAPPILFPNFTP